MKMTQGESKAIYSEILLQQEKEPQSLAFGSGSKAGRRVGKLYGGKRQGSRCALPGVVDAGKLEAGSLEEELPPVLGAHV